jgi:hypothetical protein
MSLFDKANLLALIAKAKPYLDQNLAEAHQEMMDGSIANGVYRHILSRHETMLILLSDEQLVCDYAVFFYFSNILLDLEFIAKKDNDAMTVYWDIVSLYDANGFTERNIFDAPKHPDHKKLEELCVEENNAKTKAALDLVLPIGGMLKRYNKSSSYGEVLTDYRNVVITDIITHSHIPALEQEGWLEVDCEVDDYVVYIRVK